MQLPGFIRGVGAGFRNMARRAPNQGAWRTTGMPSKPDAMPGKLGAVAFAVQSWATAFSGADCSSDALRPRLGAIGADLILRGWSGYLMEAHGGLTALASARAVNSTDWEVGASTGPENIETVRYPRERLLWFPWSVVPGKPWLACGPLDLAADSVALLGASSGHGVDTLRSKLRFLLRRDHGLTAEQQKDFVKTSNEVIESDNRIALFVNQGDVTALTTPLVGAMPGVYERAERSVALACGIPPVLVGAGAGDPRAAARRLASTQQAVANRLAAEASRALGENVTITVQSDLLQDKSRALGQLVKAGIPLSEARGIVGL